MTPPDRHRKPVKGEPDIVPARESKSKAPRKKRRTSTETPVGGPDSNAPIGDYEIGYKRPPKAHQFRQGEINNPKGRPRGRVRATDLLLREASRLVRVRKGEEVITISRAEALMRTLLNKALEGDLAATRLVMLYLMQAEADAQQDEMRRDDSAKDGATAIPQLDEEAVRRMLSRFSHLNADQGAP